MNRLQTWHMANPEAFMQRLHVHLYVEALRCLHHFLLADLMQAIFCQPEQLQHPPGANCQSLIAAS